MSAEPEPLDDREWDALLAETKAEAEAAADADPVARHELAYLDPVRLERAAVTRRNHDAQIAILGPVALAAHQDDCPLCRARAVSVPQPPAGDATTLAFAEPVDRGTVLPSDIDVEDVEDGSRPERIVVGAEEEGAGKSYPLDASTDIAPDQLPPTPLDPSPRLVVTRAERAGDDLPTVYTVGFLAELPSADEQYIIGDGILTVGGKLLLYAKSGAGKTTLLDFLAGPLSTGRPFLGRFAVERPLRVLFVQGELSLPEMASHAQQLVGAGFDSDNLMFVRMTRLKLPEGEEYLRRIVAQHRPDVLCLDPWYRLFAGESSDKPEQVGSVFDVCDRLLDEGLILAAVVVHHANVSGLRTAGSWVFEGWPSTILRLEKVPGTTHRKLTFEKIRAPSSTLDGREVRIALGEQGYLLVEADESTVTAGAILAVAIVREAGGQLHRKTLLDRLQGRMSCKSRAANKYLGDAFQGHLLVTVRDGQQVLYQLPADAPEALG